MGKIAKQFVLEMLAGDWEGHKGIFWSYVSFLHLDRSLNSLGV